MFNMLASRKRKPDEGRSLNDVEDVRILRIMRFSAE